LKAGFMQITKYAILPCRAIGFLKVKEDRHDMFAPNKSFANIDGLASLCINNANILFIIVLLTGSYRIV